MIKNSNQFLGPFDSANSALKKEFELNATFVKFDKNQHPFDVDSTLKWFFIIIEGKVKVYELNFETNREQTLYLLVRGDMYDVVTLLDNSPHEVMVDVLEKGEAIRFPIGKVKEWMRRFPSFEQLIYKYIATQIRSVENLAVDLSLYDTKERLLKLLLRNFETIEKRGVSLLDRLSHSEIASLIGTVRHIIDRHLKELKEEKVVEKEKRKIILKDAQKLLEMLKSY